jgi:hypothetical protein
MPMDPYQWTVSHRVHVCLARSFDPLALGGAALSFWNKTAEGLLPRNFLLGDTFASELVKRKISMPVTKREQISCSELMSHQFSNPQSTTPLPPTGLLLQIGKLCRLPSEFV